MVITVVRGPSPRRRGAETGRPGDARSDGRQRSRTSGTSVGTARDGRHARRTTYREVQILALLTCVPGFEECQM